MIRYLPERFTERSAEEAPLKGAGFRRARTYLEVNHVDLPTVRESFRVGEAKLVLALRDIHWKMLEDIMRRVATGKISRRNIESQRRSKFRGWDKGLGSMREVLRAVAVIGSEHAAAELKSQATRGRRASA